MNNEIKTIAKSIDINASKEKVWEVLLTDNYIRTWYAAFSEGSYAETDWAVGSKAIFTDNSKSGLVGKITANKPNEIITIEYQGVVTDGIEDYESDTAKEMKGFIETYRLSEKAGVTHLAIECDMAAKYFEMMSQSWENALQIIKKLAEDQNN